MDVISTQDEVIHIRENPWKLKEQPDYRSRRKTTGDEKKLKTYDREKTDKDGNIKDMPIDCSYIDEYCKVSAPKPSEELGDTKPRELKTNTAFGRSKIPFSKFTRTHIGGDGAVCAGLQVVCTQPVRCHQVDARTRNAEMSIETALATTTDYYEDEDISLTCCGHNIDTAVDCCTCMLCVKGIFYHCTKDSHGDTDVVDPCACNPVDGGCVKRWSALGVLAIFLPCLLLYPVARGCTEVCECYVKFQRQNQTMKDRQSRTVQNGERERLT